MPPPETPLGAVASAGLWDDRSPPKTPNMLGAALCAELFRPPPPIIAPMTDSGFRAGSEKAFPISTAGFDDGRVCPTAATAVALLKTCAGCGLGPFWLDPIAAPPCPPDAVAAAQLPGWKHPSPLTVTADPVVRSGTTVATAAATDEHSSGGIMVGPL